MTTPMLTAKLSLRTSTEQEVQVAELSKRTKLSKGEITRRALDAYIAANAPTDTTDTSDLQEAQRA